MSNSNFMARKLNSQENRQFSEVLASSERTLLEVQETLLLHNLAQRQQNALNLTPELEAWFGKEFLPPFRS